MMKKLSALTLPLLLAGLLITAPAAQAKQYTLTGRTMGTFYTVKFISAKRRIPNVWQKKINTRLREVNRKMSMFQKESEISRFNRTPAHEAFPVSADFYEVLRQSQALHQMTQGAWDGTLKPLVDLWGFGTRDRDDALPAPEAIARALERTGFSHIRLEDRRLTKTRPGLTLDLGSIAKGYGVDAIANVLSQGGITDFLVEIGGELTARGKNRKGRPWSVGISRPDKELANQGIFKIIALNNQSVATSGNYRNFFEKDGKTYSHIIDPRTGYPVENQVVSATVIARDCTFADGLATALMVMPVDQGLKLVNGLDDVECLIIRKQADGFLTSPSQGFPVKN